MNKMEKQIMQLMVVAIIVLSFGFSMMTVVAENLMKRVKGLEDWTVYFDSRINPANKEQSPSK